METREMEEKEPLLESETRKEKGGIKTLPFIIGLESLERIATFGLSPNMIMYVMGEYHLDMTTSSSILFLWSAATNVAPIIWAVIADSFLGRFYTIGFGSIVCLLGTILLWTTTIVPQAKPPSCDPSNTICSSPTVLQVMFLCASLGLISIGAGGVASSSLAFGANQIEKRDAPHQISTVKDSYFSLCYASYTVAVLVDLTVIVYIQENLGWIVGFSVPVVLLLIGIVLFFLASPLYIKLKTKTSLFASLLPVAIASYRNRHVKLPSDCANNVYHYNDSSNLVCPSANLRFLNKACVVTDPENDLNEEGNGVNPRRVCSVDEVEEVKALVRIIPLWSTGMIMAVNINQTTFPVLQAKSMDRRITPSFTIPAASFTLFTIAAAISWIVFYHQIFVPLASRIRGRPVHVNAKTKLGIGIFFSFLSVLVTAVVESFRRALATRDGYPDPDTQLSAMWLLPQHFLAGIADAASLISQNELYFSELPRSMLSMASCLSAVGMAMGSLLAGFILNVVDAISKQSGKESWVASDINEGRYDYYYLILAALSLANLVYFLICSRAYGPLKSEIIVEEEGGHLVV